MVTHVTGDTGHHGAHAPGIGQPRKDSQVTDLEEEQQHRDPRGQYHKFHEDPYQTGQVNQGRFTEGNHLVFGKITHAIPYLNWYRVQIGEGGTVMPCCMLSESNFVPIGPRTTSPVAPHNNVMVFIPPGLHYGFIVGVVPNAIADGSVVVPDWVQQGGNTGLKREKAHMTPIKMYRSGGVQDWSSNRPLDATAIEWGKITETGSAIFIDPFQVFMRVNEACGLFLNYWDSYCRLAGIQMDIQTFARQVMYRCDEGENVSIDGNIIYPWEAVGCYKDNTVYAHEQDSKGVHYELPRAKFDIQKGDEDIQSIVRCVEYGGYLGQGWQRFVMAPKGQGGTRHFKDQDRDYGLFHESIALDGSYILRSAKTICIGHRVLIPVPNRMKLPENQKDGDDSRAGNYKFSSKFGGGDDHKVGDIEVTGEEKHMQRLAGVLDILAYHYNWKGIHPFHYHKEDYKLWQESDLDPFDTAQDHLDFSSLASKDFMKDPTPKKLRVDHRYGEVDYFQRESFVVWHEDGGISIGDGYGAAIDMSGGQLRLSAPGDVMLLPGKRAVMMGWDCIIRSKNSVDISANEKDVRIKAEKNLQIMGGNSGSGGILIQSKAKGSIQVYENKYGEEVVSNGIILLAKQGEIGTLSEDLYLRTGGGVMKNGSITLDSSKGAKPIVTYSKAVHIFSEKAVNIWHPANSHCFAPNFSKLAGSCIIERNVIAVDGNMVCSKNMAAQKNIVAGKNLAHRPSPFVGFHEGALDLSSIFAAAKKASDDHIALRGPAWNGFLQKRWYDTVSAGPPSIHRLGNDTLIESLGFSYRDHPDHQMQYRTATFRMPETRWQQIVRHGRGDGGVGWVEKPVVYQGYDGYPWPGKKKWKEDPVLMGYKEHTIYDQPKGHSKDRPGPYEEPKLAGWDDQLVADGNYKTIL